ncbi:MAG: hypothetical protein OXR64_06560 [Chloroflexota bacterium]|nr:hypothetical protein [Chloroflexota bacterium]MDE2919494.1 hypothetical protein [Chloroflexota bacterium]
MRIAMLVLAFLYAALAMFTAAVGSFADGGDLWSRLVLVLLHPLAAGALLLLLLRTKASRKLVLAIAALLLATVAADLALAAAIAGGAMKGDWVLPAIFTVVPAVAVLYALARAFTSTRSDPR